MRIWMTGGTGFLGSSVVFEALTDGHDVLTTVHSFVPPADAGYQHERVDMTDADPVRRPIVTY